MPIKSSNIWAIICMVALSSSCNYDENSYFTVVDKSTIGVGNQSFSLNSIDTYYDDQIFLFKNEGIGTFNVISAPTETIEELPNYTISIDDGYVGIQKDPNNTSNWIITQQSADIVDPFYTYIDVWAEESAGLTSNNTQWSFGNGATGNIGNVLNEDWELYATSLSCEVFGTSVSIDVLENGVTVATTNHTNDNVQLSNYQFTAGNRIGFRTNTEVGAASDCRVVAHLRKEFTGIKGATGEEGVAVPDQILRVNYLGSTNINGTFVLDFNAGTSQSTIAGAVVNTNSISLPVGNYIVDSQMNLTSGVARPNVGWNYNVDGVLYSTKNGSNYIRITSGHTEAGDSYHDVIFSNVAFDLSVSTFQQAAAGNVALTNTSYLIVHRISD